MELSAQVITVMDALCEKIGIAVDWSQQNVLPYFQELIGKFITYEIATSAVWICLVLIGMFASFKGCKFLYNKSINDWHDEGGIVVAVVLGLGMTLIGTVVFIEQVFDIVTCITLPEKIIFDMISQLKIN